MDINTETLRDLTRAKGAQFERRIKAMLVGLDGIARYNQEILLRVHHQFPFTRDRFLMKYQLWAGRLSPEYQTKLSSGERAVSLMEASPFLFMGVVEASPQVFRARVDLRFLEEHQLEEFELILRVCRKVLRPAQGAVNADPVQVEEREGSPSSQVMLQFDLSYPDRRLRGSLRRLLKQKRRALGYAQPRKRVRLDSLPEELGALEAIAKKLGYARDLPRTTAAFKSHIRRELAASSLARRKPTVQKYLRRKKTVAAMMKCQAELIRQGVPADAAHRRAAAQFANTGRDLSAYERRKISRQAAVALKKARQFRSLRPS